MDLDPILRQSSSLMSPRDLPAVQNDRDDISGLHIMGSGHDLHCIPCPDVKLTDHKPVRVRVRLYGEDFPGDDLSQISIQYPAGLDLRAGQGHRIGEFLRRAVQLRHVFLQPIHRAVHLLSPLLKLLQEPTVILIEKTHIIDLIL